MGNGDRDPTTSSTEEELERAIRDYYLSLTPEELAEEDDWAGLECHSKFAWEEDDWSEGGA